jgi:hypothetical protein
MDKKLDDKKQDLFLRYSDAINKAYERAVREALLKHKRAGNPVAVYRDGAVVLLQPDEIDVEDSSDMR